MPVPLPALADLLDATPFSEFAALRPVPGKPVHLTGLAGAAPSALVASMLRADAAPVLYIAPDAREAETLANDLAAWLGEDAVLRFPGLELKPYEWREPFGRVREQRLETLEALNRLGPDPRGIALVTTPGVMLERFQSGKALQRAIVTLRPGDALDPSAFREAALTLGFREEPVVQEIGDFSVRGEVLDIYPFLAENPIRIVLDGDIVEAVREFDIFSQRSVRTLEQVSLLPQDAGVLTADEIAAGLLDHVEELGGEAGYEAEVHRLAHKRDHAGLQWQMAFFRDLDQTLPDLLGPAARVVIGDAEAFARALDRFQEATRAGYAEACAQGHLVNRPEALFLSPAEARARLARQPVVELGRLAWEGPESHVFDIEAQTRDGSGLGGLKERLAATNEAGFRTWVLCANAAQAERMRPQALSLGVEDVLVGSLSCGFTDRTHGVALLTDHQLFNRLGGAPRKRRQRSGGVAIPDFDALHRGDFVVHETYGIGRFAGIRRLRVGGHEVDCILLDYQGKDKLTLPVSDLAKLEKFSGEEGRVPVLSKLGGKAWENAKERTRKAIVLLVRELIELYAKRSVAQGYAFPPDGEMQREFEAAFEYDLTPDQARAVEEVKRDMESERPMDRLVCGDVGFGKTEVAMRAAFKAVAGRKQVAFLAPTTILASQHLETLTERFSGWPVRIEALHRFRTPAEQKATLAALERGEIDILVGTHRILSKDVVFKDLGLLVVDEEQKFGVKQKERLKELRAEVDVLAMSATPIPRTLHFSLLGARDLSLIATPPRNRLPVQTRVVFWDPDTVRAAIESELERGGQVFFVHNRVEDIGEVAERISTLVPHARTGIAHGQMPEHELERVMSGFIHREYDVLCCTSIIESGIDIPNANTLIIHRADLFGLSQLYQLRGRVGRSSTQAHCLLVAPDANRFSDDARRKLYALEKFTDLGSGFQIAMRDLEIRGAGNLLGLEQSGHIAAVGFETYVRMVQDATREVRGEVVLPPLNPEVELPADAYLPESYIEDPVQRTTLYQKLARLPGLDAVADMEAELADRFGEVPVEARMLLRTVEARIACRALGVARAETEGNALVLAFSPAHLPERDRLAAIAGAVTLPCRFLYGDPLRLSVSLNPPRRGDTEALTTMAAKVLGDMARAVAS